MASITERRFTPKEVAAAMGVSMEHIIRLINIGCLPAVNIARPGSKKARWKIRESDWRQFEDSRMNQRAEVFPKTRAVKPTDSRLKNVIQRY